MIISADLYVVKNLGTSSVILFEQIFSPILFIAGSMLRHAVCVQFKKIRYPIKE